MDEHLLPHRVELAGWRTTRASKRAERAATLERITSGTPLVLDTFERDATLSVQDSFMQCQCRHNAVLDADIEFGRALQSSVALHQAERQRESLGMLVHELRNHLHSATLALAALELGELELSSSSGAVLKRSLASLSRLLDDSLHQVRSTNDIPHIETFSLEQFVTEATDAARLEADVRGCTLSFEVVDSSVGIAGDRERLLAALINLLRNAFKFTRLHTEVTLSAYAQGSSVLIEVRDHCGGLPPAAHASMFEPFVKLGDDRSGLGLGLTIARRSVEADGGSLTARDVPGSGCVFTIQLPRKALHRSALGAVLLNHVRSRTDISDDR